MRTELLIDQPMIQLANDRRLGVIDSQMQWSGFRLRDTTIAISCVAAPVDPALPCPIQASPAQPLLDYGTLILGEHSLDLQQHLLLRAVAEGVVEKDD